MWSVHTRNETTSRRYPPEVHADLPPRTSVARGARWGAGPPRRRGRRWRRRRRSPTGGKAAERGPQGARAPLASTRVIQQPRRCRRCRRAPTSTMRLVLSHTQGVSRPHILLLDAARRTPERGERPRERFTRRPPSERSRANKPGNERPRASRVSRERSF